MRCNNTVSVVSGNPITSAAMFSTGLVGNVVALVLLEVRRRRNRSSLYHVLVTALLVTDLLGSISVSPLVLTAYARRKTLVGMSAGGEVCSYFGFSMTFLSLSVLAILCALALERYLSIGHPYFYERHLSKRFGYIALALIFLGSVCFCVAPLVGFGKYVQYCPGTWCFLQMSHGDGKVKIYIGFYASFILILISSTVVCNISVISQLVMMCRRRKARRRAVSAHSRYRRSLSMTEEVEHLLPLVIITVVFICCASPFVLRVYINLTASSDGVKYKSDADDLRALRSLSFHSIINPWVFTLRPSILRIIWRKLRNPQESTLIRGKYSQSKMSGGRLCCAAPAAVK